MAFLKVFFDICSSEAMSSGVEWSVSGRNPLRRCRALRMEASLFGVSVCVVEPGDHRSGSSKYRRHAATDNPENPYYQDYRKTIARIDHDEKNGSDPDRLGRVIAAALQKKHLPARLLIASPDQKLAVLLHRILPKKLFARFLTLYYGGRFRQKAVK